jgi:hypothetical protein
MEKHKTTNYCETVYEAGVKIRLLCDAVIKGPPNSHEFAWACG